MTDKSTRGLLFDNVAKLYDAVRPVYPPEVVRRIAAATGAGPGSPVLEIGCGSGQLTQDLVGHGFRVTAIDPGPALISLARRRVGPAAEFRVTTFEDFSVPDETYELVVCASAFHWVDPDIRWTKCARLLRDSGWLVLVDTVFEHEEPLRSQIQELWIAHSDDGGAWATNPPPPMIAQLRSSGLFDEPVVEVHAQPRAFDATTIIGLAQTSAAYLNHTPAQQESFTAGLTAAIGDRVDVMVTQGASLLLARRRPMSREAITVRYRTASVADATAIAALHARSWRATYRGCYSDEYLDGPLDEERLAVWTGRLGAPAPNQFVLVAEDDAGIVGFACAYGAHDAVLGSFLDNIHVDPDRHGEGIGAALFLAVAGWCRESDPGHGLHLKVLEPNIRARRFYERFGGADGGSTAPSSEWVLDGVRVRQYVWRTLDAISGLSPGLTS